jgi:hypothetical protein
MADFSFRNSHLLSRVEAHPMKASLAKALDAAETYRDQHNIISNDRRLSEEGKRDASQRELRAAIRDLRDLRAPVAELQAKIDAKRKAVQMPPIDRNDGYAAGLRKELRDVLRGASVELRMQLMLDPEYAEALLEAPAAVRLTQNEIPIFEQAKAKLLDGLFTRELAQIADMEEIVKEANAVFDIARNDLVDASGFGSKRPQFEEFAKPIEMKQGAPWLRRFGETVHVVVPGSSRAEIATPDEIRDGKFYANIDEYKADRRVA